MNKVLLLTALLFVSWHREVLSDDRVADPTAPGVEGATCDETHRLWRSIEAETDPAYFVAYVAQARRGKLCYTYFISANNRCRDAGYINCDAAAGDIVADVQKKLLELGFYQGPIDVEADDRTWFAISSFGQAIGRSLSGLSIDAVVEIHKAHQQLSDEITDCPVCPAMVNVPAGSFMMGSTEQENENEHPQHYVTINSGFAIGKYEITIAQWRACVDDGECRESDIKGDDNHPITGIRWDDIQQYLAWLGAKTGRKYRLPSEAEWEYAARAGTTTTYPWGDDIGSDNACCDGCASNADGRWKPSPVGSFPENGFGLHDMHGNVWEWVQDSWHDNYEGAPADGRAWQTSQSSPRVIRGGYFQSKPDQLRSAHRARHNQYPYSRRYVGMGFRVASSSLIRCCVVGAD